MRLPDSLAYIFPIPNNVKYTSGAYIVIVSPIWAAKDHMSILNRHIW